MNNNKIVAIIQKLVFLGFIFCLVSFGNKKKAVVSFQIVDDTIKLATGDGMFKYNYRITNLSKKPLVGCFELYGYEGDPGIHYYIELYKCVPGERSRYFSELKHYMVYVCPIKDTLLFQQSKSYTNLSYLNSVSEPGKYYARLVFCNELTFLGKTNYDSVIVAE